MASPGASLSNSASKEQYPVLQDYKKVSNRLELQQNKTRVTDLKVNELSKRISCLEMLARNSQRESMRYQRQLDKLEQTQDYATSLLKLKFQSYVQIQQNTQTKQLYCLTQRQQMSNRRRLSHSLFDQQRSARIARVRAEKTHIGEELFRKSKDWQATIRSQKNQVKQHEIRLKERRQRYEQFKLQRAALNYNEKLQNEFNNFKHRNQILGELRKQIQKQEEVFRKTQILHRQTSKIQSMYLTGTD